MRSVDTGPHSSSPMHRTESVDYILVLLGELEMELEGGKLVFVKAGDIVVQQGACVSAAAPPTHSPPHALQDAPVA